MNAQADMSACAFTERIWPSPVTTYLVVVSSRRPIGPRAWSFWVEMPISAPNPNSPPSTKRVEALTTTAAASTSWVKRRAAARSAVTIASEWPGPVAVHVVDGGVERRHHGDAHLEVEELATPVLVGRRGDRRQQCVVAPSSPTSSTSSSACSAAARKSAAMSACSTSDSAALHTEGRDVLALRTIASASVEVGRCVDVDVAVAVAVDHVGHGRVLEDGGDQRRPATRDEAVDHAPQLHELDGRLAGRVLDEHQRVLGQPGLGERLRAARPAMACST